MAELINKLATTPTEVLPDVLAQIDHWKWPRSDLNAWVKVLNMFDHMMEDIIRDYEVDKIQHKPFLPFAKRTLCEILRFSRLLLENSTNRKTYNSYDVSPSSDQRVCLLTFCVASQQSHDYFRP